MLLIFLIIARKKPQTSEILEFQVNNGIKNHRSSKRAIRKKINLINNTKFALILMVFFQRNCPSHIENFCE